MLLSASCLILLILVNYAFAVRDSFQWYYFRDCKQVTTEYGLVRGCANEQDRLYPFLGIPYAAPPTGLNRFKAPQPAYSWDGIFDADHSVKCSQNGEGFEDCLVVNVFTPIRDYSSVLIPVLVYLHGGAFVTGTSPVDGIKNLVRQNIVVVTVNYRLGILGFLCLGTNEAPGNAGLKDQIAALKWIQRNIDKFGGDPAKVTVYGVDAGGVSIELLILASKAKNLFHRAIVESASATSVSSMDTNPFYTAFKFARKINVPQNILNIQSLSAYYKKVNPRILSSANYEYYKELIDGTVGFAPCIENRFLRNSDPILLEPPHEILSKGRYEQIPMMFFFTSLEGLFLRSTEYTEQNYKNKVLKRFVDYLPGDLAFDTKEIKQEIARNVAYFYFGKNATEVDIMGYLKYFGDYLVLHGLLNSAELHSRNDNPVYLMEFAYKGRMGGYDKLYDNITLAGHGDVVKHAIVDKPFLNRDDKLAAKKIVKIISRFVKFGSESNYKRSKKAEESDAFDTDDENTGSGKKRVKTTPTPRKRQPTKAEKKSSGDWLTDSEEDLAAVEKATDSVSYFSRRVPNGTVRRRAYLDGDIIAEVRLYKEKEVRDLGGLERCEKAFLWLRFQGDGNSPELLKLKDFVKCAKKKFTEEGTFFQDKKKK